MEIPSRAMRNHSTHVQTLLAEVCELPATVPLVFPSQNGAGLLLGIRSSHEQTREVVSDLGIPEVVVALPRNGFGEPRLWLGLHENWIGCRGNRLLFEQCAIRVYEGSRDMKPVQIVRLEWTTPRSVGGGVAAYDGQFAGHPHWHVDRGALQQSTYDATVFAGNEVETTEVEEFQEGLEVLEKEASDFHWLSGVHFPAHCSWMSTKWRGDFPCPHQNEPTSLDSLQSWWSGSLRYIGGELRKHRG